MVDYVVILVCRISPSLRLKNWLLSRLGVTVGDGVAWGLESTPDVFWPELITVEDHAIIGYDATLLCHEFRRMSPHWRSRCRGAGLIRRARLCFPASRSARALRSPRTRCWLPTCRQRRPLLASRPNRWARTTRQPRSVTSRSREDGRYPC